MSLRATTYMNKKHVEIKSNAMLLTSYFSIFIFIEIFIKQEPQRLHAQLDPTMKYAKFRGEEIHNPYSLGG